MTNRIASEIEKKWDQLISSIRSEECIIVLGPGICMNEQQELIYDKLCEQIASELGKPVPSSSDPFYTLADELVVAKKLGNRGDLIWMVKDIYKNRALSENNPLYEDLAKIPFHLYLSMSPDSILRNVFDLKIKTNPDFHYFDYKSAYDPVKNKPDKQVPLIYNLMGSLDEDENTLVLTYDDLFEFIMNMVLPNGLPQVVQEECKMAKHFIFLGFDFESWYLKLILRVLKIQNKHFALALPWKTLNGETEAFYNRKFGITFIDKDKSHILDFVSELRDRCLKEGLEMRKPSEQFNWKDFTQKVKEFIANDEIDQAIDHLDKEKSRGNYEGDLIQIRMEYNGLRKEEIKGIIQRDDLRLGLRKIAERMIKLADSIAS